MSDLSINIVRLIARLDAAAEQSRPSESSLLMHMAAEALRELAALREGAGRWVPCTKGDPLPPDGNYWITSLEDPTGDLLGVGPFTADIAIPYDARWFDLYVIAYWSVPLPEPFSPGAAHE